MKKVCINVVVAILLISCLMLGGCKKSTEASAEDSASQNLEESTTIAETPASDTTNSETAEDNETAEDSQTEAGYTLDFDIQTEDDLVTMLTMDIWFFFDPYKNADRANDNVAIIFDKDGTFHGVQNYSREGEAFSFEGNWKIDRLYRTDDELPDYISLDVTSFENPYIRTDSFGDYIFDNFGIVDGQYVMGLRRVSRWDTVFGAVKDPVLYMGGTTTPVAPEFEAKPNITSDGYLWQMDTEGDKTVFWIGDFAQSNNSKINVMTKVYASSDAQSEYPFEAFYGGFYPITYTTDANGELVNITKRAEALDTGVEEYNYYSSLNSKITGYEIKTRDYSYYYDIDKRYMVEAFFQQPVFGGSDKAVKELNDVFTQMREDYEKEIFSDEFRQVCKDAFNKENYDNVFSYKPYRTSRIYYDEDTVSVWMYWEWNMADEYTREVYVGVNRDLNTGEEIKIYDVLGMSKDEALDYLADKALESYYFETWSKDYVKEWLGDLDEINYSFDKGNIYVEAVSEGFEDGVALSFCVDR